MHPGTLDSAFQTTSVALMKKSFSNTLNPTSVERAVFFKADPLKAL